MNSKDDLTPREQEVLAEIRKGKSNKQIALKFRIAVHTVERHNTHIFSKLGVQNRTEAAVYDRHQKR